MGLDLRLFMADWEQLSVFPVEGRIDALDDSAWPPELDDDRWPEWAGGWRWPPGPGPA
ncbi:hypothetical protein [Streptomyces triculaminicus]|uniref:hypothetical protein n=1 Tax=Streptomyces triculaminicus TaxID=2816232 RepID=UPI0037D6749A